MASLFELSSFHPHRPRMQTFKRPLQWWSRRSRRRCGNTGQVSMSHYSCFEKGRRKKCTLQSRKVLWVVFSSLFFKEISKNGTRGQGRMFARAKGNNKSRFDSYSVKNKCIDHIPYYLSGLSRAQLLRQPFSKQLYMYVTVCLQISFLCH